MIKSSIIKGTLILTAAGLLTRVIGFIYRIYLSNALGAEQLGIYQLIFPVYGICHTLYASGIQTAISKLVAETESSVSTKNSARRILLCGAFLSFLLATACSILLYCKADTVAIYFLKEAACAPSLRILSFIFPFCGITSCINGYSYGRSKSSLPAFTQVIEQVIRVGTVFFASTFSNNIVMSCELAIFGVLAGELASNLVSVLCIWLTERRNRILIALCSERSIHGTPSSYFSAVFSGKTFRMLLQLSTPLTLNRLLLSLLHSFEAITIPTLLRRSGMSSSDALSHYGILNGMALPFVYFASAITNALAVLLLPAISEQDAAHNQKRIASTTERSVSITLLLGIFCNFLFLFFGTALGNVVFHNSDAGSYIKILSCLCPFLYLTTTLSSILNGLGKTMTTFATSLIGSVIRIALLFVLVPRYSMTGCFIALLLSQLILCASELILVHYHTDFKLNVYRTIILPALVAAMGAFLCHRAYLLFTGNGLQDSPVLLLVACSIYTLLYLILPVRILFLRKS